MSIRDTHEHFVIYLPKDVAQAIRKRLIDPRRGRMRDGALSELITYLLREHLRKEPENRALLEEMDKVAKGWRRGG